MKDQKGFTEIYIDSVKQRIRYLESKDPGKKVLGALIKLISHNLSRKRKN